MGIGPFDTFSFPGVYTKTLTEPPLPTAAGSLRIPAFIGVANETIPVNNYEMIRGSSSMADNKIVRENVSSQFTGSNRDFGVKYFPIVSGNGTGTVTDDPSKVTVTVNGNPVAVSTVSGSTGRIYLVSIPASGDEVLVTYYYKKTDTLHTDEDLSDQIDGVAVSFRTDYYPIVQGDNGGIPTTDPTKIKVYVNGSQVTVVSLDGANGLFTLASPPLPTLGATLKVTYYSNELQDTSDILPSPYVDTVTKVGYAPGTSDFIAGVDYVLDTSGSFSSINWGHSYKVVYGVHTVGATYFDSAQVESELYDHRVYRRAATGTVDGTNKTFTMPFQPTTGSGRGILTEDPNKLGEVSTPHKAFWGVSPTDASAINVTQIIKATNQIKLETAPPVGTRVYVSEYMNNLPDDAWTFKNLVAGGSGDGTYTVTGTNTGIAMDVRFSYSLSDSSVADTDFASEGIIYPAGPAGSADKDQFSDAMVIPGYAVAETVHLTFIDATHYSVTSTNSSGTGSVGDNTGYLNQTYIDNRTGFRVTILKGNLVTYATGDKLGYIVTPNFAANSLYKKRGIPGLTTLVASTAGIGVNDTGIVNTYNKSGAEPDVGDFYYVSFNETKQFNSSGMIDAAMYTQEKDVLAATGDLTINNKVGLAAHLAFLNGAAAVIIKQIERTVGAADAPDSRYISAIDSFKEPMAGGIRPALMEPVTTSSPVITYLKESNVIQSGIRYANERMSYFGFPINTTPTQAQVIARSFNSERMIGLYPDGAITTITDAYGNDVEYLVDGAYLAAAISGRDVSPAFDVAEPLDRKPVVGFRRLYRRMDSVTAAQTANAGLTIIEEIAAGMQVKMALTTDVSSVLNRTPSVTRIKDFVQKGARSILDPYIGQKFLSQKTNEIQTTLNAYLRALTQADIIKAYTGVRATPDANDPTIVNVVAYYSPVLPLLWIVITFNLRSSL